MLDEEEKRKLSEALNKVSSSEPPSGKPQADTAVTDKAEFKAGQTTGNVTVLQRQAQPTGGECQFVRVTVYKNGQERQERQWQCRGK